MMGQSRNELNELYELRGDFFRYFRLIRNPARGNFVSPRSPLEGQPTPLSSEGPHTFRRATRVHEGRARTA